MSGFSDNELADLAEPRLGGSPPSARTAWPHIVPLGWSYSPALDTIDIGGRDFCPD